MDSTDSTGQTRKSRLRHVWVFLNHTTVFKGHTHVRGFPWPRNSYIHTEIHADVYVHWLAVPKWFCESSFRLYRWVQLDVWSCDTGSLLSSSVFAAWINLNQLEFLKPSRWRTDRVPRRRGGRVLDDCNVHPWFGQRLIELWFSAANLKTNVTCHMTSRHQLLRGV